MNRRELLKMVAAATGGVVIGGEFFLTGCKNPDAGVGTSATFAESDIAFLDEVAETIQISGKNLRGDNEHLQPKRIRKKHLKNKKIIRVICEIRGKKSYAI